ncbi:tRNA (adenosine(37)-N6)-dimethylallyltransferase MiaA [Sphingobacterium bovistauri]|uniref:tRNA dimethylallyltransferase n=1 Tax=Sphingobacterium bovistauri TaxID=2781959 RepID=A0ABS7Z7S6_9SPHI|nr:tRNA (adenosine(37)-N6)-dimethylallyltransferase MiaA [Sphingobacterium bovistauri]MCA5005642.1 tRNA (adenosine(37)-N6)-dimethylallyltransferase MiaA [Sphingobacterium bovistauri]
MIYTQNIIKNLQEDSTFLPEDLLIVLGPTASGKTKFAVELAKQFNAEIISADSRQVYRHMNIGTGKDLAEYQDVAYHLIDIINPGEKYNIDSFIADFAEAYQDILSRGKRVIVCGGTGFYIQSLLQPQPFIRIPINLNLRDELETRDKEELVQLLSGLLIPNDFKVDFSSRKRIIRAIEICEYLSSNPDFAFESRKNYGYKIIGLNPSVEVRRERISKRLKLRLDEGMIDEARSLMEGGVSYDDLEYYGLEYKYISYYLKGTITYDDFYKKLETEIHRYAKRQMTYFRKMEKDSIAINWI